MKRVEQIRKRGFRKWYERQLIDGHLHLVTAFLCLIAVLGAIEQGGPYNSWERGLWLLLVATGLGALGAWSYFRYLAILQVAEYLGDRSTCPQCRAYARFTLLHTGPREGEDLPEPVREMPLLFVECRKCAHHWRM